jgi:hypothetical protein
MTDPVNIVGPSIDNALALSITLDIADVVSAIAWPLLIVVLLILMRGHLPGFFTSLAGLFRQVKKVSIGDFSLEMATASAFAPTWTPTDSTLDMRKSMSGVEVNNSSVQHFISQFTDPTPADYVVVDLSEGHEWLTSRLYIFSMLMKRSKGISVFVFVKTLGNRTRRLVGWSDPDAIRWALARRYPLLEQAYADAYTQLFPPPDDAHIVSAAGMLGTKEGERSPELIVSALQGFLVRVQKPEKPEGEETHWEEISAQETTYEYASWLTADGIEDLLGDQLNREYIRASELDRRVGAERSKRILQVPQRYIPLVDDSDKFRELIDRQVVLEYLAAEFS